MAVSPSTKEMETHSKHDWLDPDEKVLGMAFAENCLRSHLLNWRNVSNDVVLQWSKWCGGWFTVTAFTYLEMIPGQEFEQWTMLREDTV